MPHDAAPARQSLDSARFPRLPRSAIHHERRFEREPPTPEESFEEVGLNDEQRQQQQQQHPAKKRGFFSKFGSDGSNPEPGPGSGNPPTTVSRFAAFHSRKRGHSGQGSELGAIERPATASSADAQEAQS